MPVRQVEQLCIAGVITSPTRKRGASLSTTVCPRLRVGLVVKQPRNLKVSDHYRSMISGHSIKQVHRSLRRSDAKIFDAQQGSEGKVARSEVRGSSFLAIDNPDHANNFTAELHDSVHG